MFYNFFSAVAGLGDAVARISSDRAIAAGIAGGVGICAPCGWKPFSSAIYVTLYVTPSSPCVFKKKIKFV